LTQALIRYAIQTEARFTSVKRIVNYIDVSCLHFATHATSKCNIVYAELDMQLICYLKYSFGLLVLGI